MAREVRIISVGKAHDPKLVDAIAEYEKRTSPSFRISWLLLPPKSETTPKQASASESQSILQTLEDAEYVILLDETGKHMTSEEFSKTVFDALTHYKKVSCIIGGAYGVNELVKQRANTVVSFGKMVLPHQLMRLVLSEQLYRASAIHNGSDYHHA